MFDSRSPRFMILAAVLLVALISATFLGQTAAAAGATVLHVDVATFLGDAPNHPCTGGDLEASGNITAVLHEANNGYFLHVGPGQSNVTMTDVDTGETYLFTGALNQRVKFSGSGTAVHHLNFISQGSSVSFVGQTLSHLTMTPGGETAVSFEWGSFECK